MQTTKGMFDEEGVEEGLLGSSTDLTTARAVGKKTEAKQFRGGNQRTCLCQANAPTHMGHLGWAK